MDPSTNEILVASKEAIKEHRFQCCGCGYIYDPQEGLKKFDIPKGTAFLEIDKSKFRCPVCRSGIDAYKDIGSRLKPSGFDENLSYGFGFNTLPSGQKNVLIFGGLAFAAACFLSLYSLR
ncbi:rubredoxin [Prochlorococcus sp. MIT 1223]|uniref:rubredoxin n=1 Tax=Prochlorococcus sp. MIT 1223 TaxID=3096217 RepID=UPI002A74D5B7|nr:rubredoxin [Prochlorococcus sp. MIT 1223]